MTKFSVYTTGPEHHYVTVDLKEELGSGWNNESEIANMFFKPISGHVKTDDGMYLNPVHVIAFRNDSEVKF